MLRLVQLHDGSRRRVAVVEEPRLRVLANVDSVHALVEAAISRSLEISAVVAEFISDEILNYDEVYFGKTSWRLMCPFDYPGDAARTLVSGTGLTHLGSARDRQAMHTSAIEDQTDSMKMFRSGLEGGRPAAGAIGVAPEWFYKGNGTILRAPGEPLDVPGFAEDGGEEAEIAGVYIIAPDGTPARVGMVIGNEFSDHRFEKRNYLNLAGSKIRTCSIGPELIINPLFQSVSGNVSIERGGKTMWSKSIRTGEAEMCHSLANIEHHHFKFDAHRRPGDVHIHYFGACALSFGDGVKLIDGDMMVIAFEGFGRPLRNPCQVAAAQTKPIAPISMR